MRISSSPVRGNGPAVRVIGDAEDVAELLGKRGILDGGAREVDVLDVGVAQVQVAHGQAGHVQVVEAAFDGTEHVQDVAGGIA